jgi:NUMOD3 motif
MTGSRNPFYGRRHSEETRAVLAQKSRRYAERWVRCESCGTRFHIGGKRARRFCGVSCRNKWLAVNRSLWHTDPERMRAAFQRGLEKWRAVSPNGLERRVLGVIDRHDLGFRFVGGGTTFIGGKVPDFMGTGKRRLLIEVAGNYWHSPVEMKARQDLFGRYGFKTLVLWESEMNTMGDEEIARRIRAFREE